MVKNERLVTLVLGKRGWGSPIAGITDIGTSAVSEVHPSFRRMSVTNLSFLTIFLGRGVRRPS